MTEQQDAINEINSKMSDLVSICRGMEVRGKEKDITTVKGSLEIFEYTVKEFSACLPKDVLLKIVERQQIANKLVNELIEKLKTRANGWSI